MTSIGICGITGRMGQMIVSLLDEFDDLRLAGGVEAPGSKMIGTSVTASSQTITVGDTPDFPMDVLIDFSSPAATKENLKQAAAGRFALVVGTTGLDKEHESLIDTVAKSRAVLVAPNMSLGMNILFDLVQRSAQQLGVAYDVEIVEMHHRHKKDAPSGSALRLLKAVQDGRGTDRDTVGYGREGMTGERKAGSIQVHAVRGGDVPGDHTVIFAGSGERIELTHRATSRVCFARGALQAARFAATAQPGRYTMVDVLSVEERR